MYVCVCPERWIRIHQADKHTCVFVCVCVFVVGLGVELLLKRPKSHVFGACEHSLLKVALEAL